MISKGRSVGCEHLLRPSLSKYGPLERVRVRCVEKARYVCSQHKFALGADACSLDLPPAKGRPAPGVARQEAGVHQSEDRAIVLIHRQNRVQIKAAAALRGRTSPARSNRNV